MSLSVKLLLGFTLVFSLVFSLAFAWFYAFSTQSALDHIKGHLDKIVAGTEAGIIGDDFEKLAKLPPRSDGALPSSPDYVLHQRWLNTVHQIEPRAIPYTFVASGKGKEVLWIGDVLRTLDPSRASAFKESYDASASKLYGGLSGSVVNMTPYQDKWGNWVSAYMPIRNSQGRVVGGVGVDFSANHVYEVQNAIRNQMWRAFLITYGVLFVLVAIFSRAFTEPLRRLSSLAGLVGEGRYDVDFSSFSKGRLHDEISRLGVVFGATVDKVRERELSLRREVQELRIEIDQAKKEKQVKDIVDTDFFRDLKGKAASMRARASQSNSDDAAPELKDKETSV